MPPRHGIFVIGGGGREHALIWHLARAYPGRPLYCAPGNPGIARLATCLPIPTTDLAALADVAASLDAELTVVGPEAPLVAGVVDVFAARGLPILGPTAAAARIEGSKAYAKRLMERARVPTAAYAAFSEPASALAHLRTCTGPLVVKADGLAAGKGVVLCDDPEAAELAVVGMMVDGDFGDAGRTIVIEERLEGDEISAFALVDGEAVALLPVAQDHKRALDGDLGPNTGGMGAVAPYPLPALAFDRIRVGLIEPVAHAMCAEGHPFRGVLFAGLMLTADGPLVIEFNCRLGDPEAQVLLPLLHVSLPDAFADLAAGRLNPSRLLDVDRAAAGVVLASRGYPEQPQIGDAIGGLDAAAEDALLFHSGTAVRDDQLVTASGRVLTVVGEGSDIASARTRAYQAVGRIQFTGMRYRHDIGARVPGVTDAPTAPLVS